MIPVNSSRIKAYEYDPETQTLSIQFLKGEVVYDYFDVPQSAVKELEEAESKGGHLATIGKKYRYSKREAKA